MMTGSANRQTLPTPRGQTSRGARLELQPQSIRPIEPTTSWSEQGKPSEMVRAVWVGVLRADVPALAAGPAFSPRASAPRRFRMVFRGLSHKAWHDNHAAPIID
jgi:hypothetical protein